MARRLPGWDIRPVIENDVAPILALFQTDPEFFSLNDPQPDAAYILRDMKNLPPRCTMEQKHYLALWKDGAPRAVLDLVEGYPRERTLFVGLFFLDPSLRRQGTGREMMDAVLQAAGDAGMDSVRLACLLNNPIGHAFWHAVGFGDLRQGKLLGEHSAPVWIMERLI